MRLQLAWDIYLTQMERSRCHTMAFSIHYKFTTGSAKNTTSWKTWLSATVGYTAIKLHVCGSSILMSLEIAMIAIRIALMVVGDPVVVTCVKIHFALSVLILAKKHVSIV